MCGVIGYVGKSVSPDFIYNCLKRLEYRGYDSAGIAMLNVNKDLEVIRAEGKLDALKPLLQKLPASSTIGIGHTRWATHGKPSENNAHPHRSGPIALLHNGIIENYREIKGDLLKKGYKFSSETDTEAAVHLLHETYKNQPKDKPATEKMRLAIFEFVKKIKGAFAFGIICTETPDHIYAIKHGSPMVLGKGISENYFASGMTALIEHTKDFLSLDDEEIAFMSLDKIEITNFSGKALQKQFVKVNWSPSMVEKGGYRHFMLKEIYEHPVSIANTLSAKVSRDLNQINPQSLSLDKLNIEKIKRIVVLACGTSFYASLLGKYYIETLTQIPVEVEYAHEFRYRDPACNEETLAIAVSQSGETMDTLQAIKMAKSLGAQTLGIINVPGSSIGQIVQAETLTLAGPEIGVASTKAFTTQVLTFILLSIGIGQSQKKNQFKFEGLIEELYKIPNILETCLSLTPQIEALAKKIKVTSNLLFMGRGPQWAVALEGALKLKELSYIHSEAYAGGELKHGTIALIDESMHVICLLMKDRYNEKMLSNIQEVKARQGKIITFTNTDDPHIKEISDECIMLPDCHETIAPFISTIPLHLLAYWVAVEKGTDVDQPRNLAKSVTVE